MKKIFSLVLLIVLVIVLYNPIKNSLSSTVKQKFLYEDILNNISNKKVDVDRFTIYGKHLNIEGKLPNNEDYTLVLKNNEEEIKVNTIINNNRFTLANHINEGLDLEKLKVGDYILLLKNNVNNDYYNLINKTEYHDNIYYTITKNKKNNMITLPELSFNNIDYWTINITEERLPDDIYDIVIDPGHGGIDTGASNGKYHESKYTLEYSKALYDELTKAGLKVKLTREDEKGIEHYGKGSRTGIPYETKAKLMLSIHLNSSNGKDQHGVEIYKAYNDNSDYARIIAKNIVDEVGTNYSINTMHQVEKGVYMRVYSKSDIESLNREAKRNNYEPYDIPENATYYYFVRETGGILTKAFSDGRNPKYKENLYRNYNQGVEAYLCELAYISNKNDLELILNKKNAYVKALKNSVLSYFQENNISEES